MKPLLVLILVIAAGGLAFSGYLTYQELLSPSAGQCTPIGPSGSVLGAPPCVYGFVMYLAIVVFAGIALFRRRTAT